ncbi:TetR/AcrR family transcriptional regulator [Sporosalibacterium faouarense]|uniref:TetR/AcrR family transcriptional regulator n=1 Tax=Sporosalibacterium faouarense TaxID=516123 RepID=UPI00141D5679|nr:TetR/AcrR family transcriptional regulator [Sporosalibacterium faouarense]MTI46306.1 TetR/AcrR family transcriptional regulator [Bacillota bacterium]
MNGFDRRKQKKMNDILTAAFDLFKKNGIEAVKITDVAEKANVSKVTIYNYFGSKEELARQVIFDYMDKKAEEFKTYMSSDLSFKDKFNLMITVKMGSVDELTDGSTDGLLDNDMILSPQVQEFLKTYAETKIKPIFINFIEQGKQEGEIDSEINTETILKYIQSINNILQYPISVQERIDLGKLFFYGLRGK